MNRRSISAAMNTLSVLNQQQLNKITRGGASIFLSFGELIESESFYHNEDGKLAKSSNGNPLRKKKMVGKYALHFNCSMRLTYGDKVAFTKSDVFRPNLKLANDPNFDLESFDWDNLGKNYFDEMVSKYIGNEPRGFIVESLIVSKFGDLKISFKNDFVLELFTDCSSGDESWRFFEVGSDKLHFVMLGSGIQDEDDED